MPSSRHLISLPLRSGRRTRHPATFVAMIAVLAASVALPAAASADDPPFTIETFTAHTVNVGGTDDTTAGGHPDRNVVEFTIPSLPPTPQGNVNPVEDLKDAWVTLPPGFVGNPAVAARCPLEKIGDPEFDGSPVECPSGSQVGSVVLGVAGYPKPRPLFNIAPTRGYPAAFAFRFLTNVVILAVTPLPRTASYGLSVGSINANRIAINGFSSTFFGVPSQHGSGSTEAPFLSNPLDCSEAEPTWRLAISFWNFGGPYLPSGFPDLSDPDWKTAGAITPPVTGCDDPALVDQWNPALETKPLQPGGGPVQADQPTGLAVDLDFPQSNDPTDLNSNFDPSIPQAPEPKDITVKLPAGLSINPSSADGLGACSDLASNPAGDQVHYDNTKPAECPDASKIGSVTALSPLLALHDPISDAVIGPEPIPGQVYLLAPHSGDLPIGGGTQEGKFRLLIELENPRYGINIKLPGVATADPNTGQLTATFTQNPQLPASHITVNLIEGPRAPLASPVTCVRPGDVRRHRFQPSRRHHPLQPPPRPRRRRRRTQRPGGNPAQRPGRQVHRRPLLLRGRPGGGSHQERGGRAGQPLLPRRFSDRRRNRRSRPRLEPLLRPRQRLPLRPLQIRPDVGQRHHPGGSRSL